MTFEAFEKSGSRPLRGRARAKNTVIHHRSLTLEPLEDRRLLSLLPFELPDGISYVENTWEFPHSATVAIYQAWDTNGNGTFDRYDEWQHPTTGELIQAGTGSLIDNYHVLTAAHVVLNEGEYKSHPLGFADFYFIYPGRTGHFLPGGEIRVVGEPAVPEEYLGPKDWSHDIAVLTLDRNIGFLNHFNWSDNSNSISKGVHININHYPGEVDEVSGYPFDGTQQFYSEGPIDEIWPDTDRFSYLKEDAWTTGGSSGSPVFLDDNTIVGVHCAGSTNPPTGSAVNLTAGHLTDFLNNSLSGSPPMDLPSLVDYDRWFNKNTSHVVDTTTFHEKLFPVQVNIANVGTAPAYDVPVELRLSRDPIAYTHPSDTTFLTTVTIPSIEPLSVHETLVYTTVPTDLPPGEYYVTWTIDPDNLISEFDTPLIDFMDHWDHQKGFITQKVTVIGKPNLEDPNFGSGTSYTSFSPNPVKQFEPYHSECHITNTGYAASGAFNVALMVDNYVIAIERAPALEPNESTVVNFDGLFPAVPLGDHELTWRIDYGDSWSDLLAGGEVDEFREWDNGYRITPFTVLHNPNPGQIHGHVYTELGMPFPNYVWDPGEPGIEGWKVFIDEDGDRTWDSGEMYTLTEADGSYSFTGLAYGTHTVVAETRPGWLRQSPITSWPLTIATDHLIYEGADFATVHAGGEVLGRCWDDRDQNGSRDPGEPYLVGWTVYLDANGNAVLDPGEKYAETDALGNYGIYRVGPGNYEVRLQGQSLWEQTSPADSHSITITSAQEVLTDLDFTANYVAATIRGTVFDDVNQNGQWDSDGTGGDRPLAGCRVYIDENQNGVWDEALGEPATETDGAGKFQLDVLAGTHWVGVEVMPGYVASIPALVAGLTDPHLEVEAVAKESLEVEFGQEYVGGFIEGTVFYDQDGDGVWDQPDEVGMADWMVYVDLNVNGSCDDREPRAYTGADGSYTLLGFPEGTYRVAATPKFLMNQTLPVSRYWASVGSTETASGFDFGFSPLPYDTSGVIRGIKWNDRDEDGVRDPGEPGLEGWTIYVDLDEDGLLDAGEPLAVTDATGAYEISGLSPGTYLVREVAQQHWTQTAPVAVEANTVRVSTGPSGDESRYPSYLSQESVSADGRFVVFESYAINMIPHDENWQKDVFVKDMKTGDVQLVSATVSGLQANGRSGAASISADGRFVVFVSEATNLLPIDDNNDLADILVKDLLTGSITRASTGSLGEESDRYCVDPTISADGRYVAFVSQATNLVPGDENGKQDVFVKDLVTGELICASSDFAGVQGDGESTSPSISANGRYVAFRSNAENLISGGISDYQIYVKDLQTGQVVLASSNESGEQAAAPCGPPSIAADGRSVAFSSFADNLVPTTLTEALRVYVKDLDTNVIVCASTDSAGNPADAPFYYPELSGDASSAAFSSYEDVLTGSGTGAFLNIYVKKLLSGEVSLASADLAGGSGDGSSYTSSLSFDGRFVAFDSYAKDLVSDDTNTAFDVFCRDFGVPFGVHHVTITAGQDVSGIDFGGQNPASEVGFAVFADEALTTRGLTGSYVNASLRDVNDADWTDGSQTISGTRVDSAISFRTSNWGSYTEVGVTGGWDYFSVQWDGYVHITRGGTTLRTYSDDSSRMWIDINRDGVFDSSGSELINNHWGIGQLSTYGDYSIPLAEGVYPIRIQYEDGPAYNIMELVPGPTSDYLLFTNATATTRGLVGSYVDTRLADQDDPDWTDGSQTIAGTRVDAAINFFWDGWGARAPLNLTGGTDDNWDNFSVQWDGYIDILADGTTLRTFSDDSSRMWIDINGDGAFDTAGPEFVDNHWGRGQGVTYGLTSVPLPAGHYRFRIQYEEGVGGNNMRLQTGPAESYSLYTDPERTTPGLLGSYVDTTLAKYMPQDDWRDTQTIAGTRIDANINMRQPTWGELDSVGLTGGTDSDWDDFSVQWDGYIEIHTDGTSLRTWSDDCARMWIDVNGDGVFSSTAPELLDNRWGQPHGAEYGQTSVALASGLYKIRIQYAEGLYNNLIELEVAPPAPWLPGSPVAAWQFVDTKDLIGPIYSDFAYNGAVDVGINQDGSYGPVAAQNSDQIVATDTADGFLSIWHPSDDSELLPAGAVTLFARVNFSSFDGIDDIISMHRDIVNDPMVDHIYGLEFVDGVPRFSVHGEGVPDRSNDSLSFQTALSTNTWYDITGVFDPGVDGDGLGTLRLYVFDPQTGQAIGTYVEQTVSYDALETSGVDREMQILQTPWDTHGVNRAQIDLAVVWTESLSTYDIAELSSVTPRVTYVDDNFSGRIGDPIADADLGTAGAQPAVFGVDAFATIAEAIAGTANSGTIIVNGGTYFEAVNLLAAQTLKVPSGEVAQTITVNSLSGEAETTLDLEGSIVFAGAGTSTVGRLNVRSNRPEPVTITIPAGHALTVTGDVSVGVPDTIGAITNLIVSGGGEFNISNPSATVDFGLANIYQNSTENLTTVDLSGLGAFNADVDSFRVAFGSRNRSTLLLSNTSNTITANVMSVSDSGNQNCRPGIVTLGAGANTLHVNTIEVGLGKGNGKIAFASQIAGSPGTVVIRGQTGGTSGANITLACDDVIVTGATIVGTLDLRGHTADVIAETLTLARRTMGGSGGIRGTLSVDAGMFIVDVIDMATKSGGDQASTATLNIGGGVFTVNAGGSFQLADQTGGGAAEGTVNITGGSLISYVDITDGGGSSTTTVTLDGGSLDLTGHQLGGATPIDALGFHSGTLRNVAQVNNGALGLTKTTAGTLIVEGTNTYTGPTTVGDGILQIDGSITSNVVVNTDGTLHGSGFITGNVSGTGTFSPGSGPGRMTVDGDFVPSGTVRFEVNSPFAAGVDCDQYVVSGSVDLSGASLEITTNTPGIVVLPIPITLIANDAAESTVPGNTPADGSEVVVGSATCNIFYNAADGNDVVLASGATIDYADAPAPYPTLFMEDGAGHIATGPTLGTNRDHEPDGLPEADALGDDNDGTADDEDGITTPPLLAAGIMGSLLTVDASATSFLNAWIDYNRNGIWEPNEQIAVDLPLDAGPNVLSLNVPLWAVPGTTYSRFRLTSYDTGGSLGPAGFAIDGEVEDYAWIIEDNICLYGTAGDDTITVQTGVAGTSLHRVTINGTLTTYDPVIYQAISIDTLGGSDTISVVETTGAETVSLNASSVNILGPAYEVNATSVETIYVYGGAGDTANLTGDLAGGNTFKGRPTYSELEGPTCYHYVSGFDTVSATPGGGSNNRALLYGSAGADTLTASASTATIDWDGVPSATASGFNEVLVFGAAGDTANLTGDGAGGNTLYGRPAYSELKSPAFYLYAGGFDTVTASPGGGINNRALLYGGTGADTFTTTPTSAIMDLAGAPNITATGFNMAMGIGSTGDTANLTGDSAGDNFLQSRLAYTNMSGASYYYLASGFQAVTAASGGGTNNRAFFYNDAAASSLTANPTIANMDWNGTSSATVSNFDRVFGFGSAGDMATFSGNSAGNNTFEGRPDYNALTGTGYYHYANGFDSVNATAGGGTNNRAFLYGGTGADTLSAGPTTGTMTWNSGRLAQMAGFDKVFGYGSTGDTANLAGDATTTNTFDGYSTYSTLYSAMFYHYVSGFDLVTATGGSATNDRANFYDSVLDDLFTSSPGSGQMDYGDDASTNISVLAFERIHARFLNGGNDDANLTDSAAVDQYIGSGANGQLTDAAAYWLYLYFDSLGTDTVTLNSSTTGNTIDADSLDYVLNYDPAYWDEI